MTDHVRSIIDTATVAKTGVAVVTAGTGAAEYMEMFRNVLATASMLVGFIVTTWILVDKIRETIKKRKADNSD